MTVPFIFVELGRSKSTVRKAARQVHSRFPDSEIFVITDQRHKPMMSPKIQFIDAAKLERDFHWRKFLDTSELNSDWRDGFWLKTSERIFAINSFIQNKGLNQFIHLENDIILLSDPSAFIPLLNSDISIAFPFENYQLGCLSFLYISKQESMDELCKRFNEICHRFPGWSEMRILGEIQAEDSSFINVLPSIPSIDFLQKQYFEKEIEGELLHSGFNFHKAIYDPTAYGFYLGGEDPRNSHFKKILGRDLPTTVIETSGLKWSLRGTKELPELWVSSKSDGEFTQILNLHVHCKDLKTDDDGLYKWLQKRVEMANNSAWRIPKFATIVFLRSLIAGQQRKLAIYSLAKHLKILN